jgi:hypothetical protein
MRWPRSLTYNFRNTVNSRGTPGGLADVMSFLIKGSMLRPEVAENVLTIMTSIRQGALAKVSATKFIGRSSDNLCVVHATLPCKVYDVKLDEKLNRLPKDIQEYYIQSAISDALMKARRMVYEASEESRNKAMSYLYEELQEDGEGRPMYQMDPETEEWKYGEIFQGIIEDDMNEADDMDYRTEVLEAMGEQGLDSREIEEIRSRVTRDREEKAKQLALKMRLEEAESLAAQKELENAKRSQEEREHDQRVEEAKEIEQEESDKIYPDQQGTKEEQVQVENASIDLSDLINEIKN